MQSLYKVLVVVLVVMGIATCSLAARISIDFEEQPRADLSKISNIYHGDASFLYAFLVVLAEPLDGDDMPPMTVPHSYTADQSLEPVSGLRFLPSSAAVTTPREPVVGNPAHCVA